MMKTNTSATNRTARSNVGMLQGRGEGQGSACEGCSLLRQCVPGRREGRAAGGRPPVRPGHKLRRPPCARLQVVPVAQGLKPTRRASFRSSRNTGTGPWRLAEARSTRRTVSAARTLS